MQRQDVFTHIYDTNDWSDPESISGVGSSLKMTQGIREQLPRFFNDWKIKTVVDAPCGDYHWFKDMEVDIEKYTGIDIVNNLIQNNQSKYADSEHVFLCMDLCTDIIPKADLILCRDCLIHLSNEDSFLVLQNFKRSGSKYLLITTNPDNPCNIDIETGKFRHLNMTKEPFNFPEPLALVNEKYTGMFADKSLGLWKLSNIPL